MATSSSSSIESGALVRQWTWPLRMVFWWAVISVCVWAWALAAHWYWGMRAAPDNPVAYHERVLEQEMRALEALRPGLLEPAKVAVAIGTGIRDSVLLTAVGFARTLMHWPVAYRRAAQGESIDAGFDPGAAFVSNEVLTNRTFHHVLMLSWIFAVRTAMFISSLPLLLLAGAVGLVDGLVARAKRKANAGRESASIYHRAKLGVTSVAILGYIVTVALPSFANPTTVLVPMVLGVGVLIRLQAAFYKKYL